MNKPTTSRPKASKISQLSEIRELVRFAEQVNTVRAEFIRESTDSGELLQTMAAVESRVKHLCRVCLENTNKESEWEEVSLYNYIRTLSVPSAVGSAGWVLGWAQQEEVLLERLHKQKKNHVICKSMLRLVLVPGVKSKKWFRLHEHVGVLSAVENVLQLLQLQLGERSTVAALLSCYDLWPLSGRWGQLLLLLWGLKNTAIVLTVFVQGAGPGRIKVVCCCCFSRIRLWRATYPPPPLLRLQPLRSR